VAGELQHMGRVPKGYHCQLTQKAAKNTPPAIKAITGLAPQEEAHQWLPVIKRREWCEWEGLNHSQRVLKGTTIVNSLSINSLM
jgi:hypothetical protein